MIINLMVSLLHIIGYTIPPANFNAYNNNKFIAIEVMNILMLK
jgi:hypothetical protein